MSNKRTSNKEGIQMIKDLWNMVLSIFGLDHLGDLFRAIFKGGNIMDVLR